MIKILTSGYLAMAALLASAAPAVAADADGHFAVRGPGTEACSRLAQATDGRKTEVLSAYASWLMGYLSAYNRLSGDTFDMLPTLAGNDGLAVLALVCRDHPEMLVETAAARMIQALHHTRLTRDSSVVTIKHDGRSVFVRQEAIEMLQDRLKALGFYDGKATGKGSKAFSRAVLRFQKSENLSPTGLPDIDTMLRAALREER